jgi:hypothetical protein
MKTSDGCVRNFRAWSLSVMFLLIYLMEVLEDQAPPLGYHGLVAAIARLSICEATLHSHS